MMEVWKAWSCSEANVQKGLNSMRQPTLCHSFRAGLKGTSFIIQIKLWNGLWLLGEIIHFKCEVLQFVLWNFMDKIKVRTRGMFQYLAQLPKSKSTESDRCNQHRSGWRKSPDLLLELTWFLLIEELHSPFFFFFCLLTSVKVNLHLVHCKVLSYFQLCRSLWN